MGSLIKNLGRKTTPALRFISATKPPQLCDPSPAVFLRTSSSPLTNSSNALSDSTSVLNSLIAQNPTKPSQFYYPSFPFAHIFNPISVAGSDQLNVIKAEVTENDDDARTMWADSVKKKRKKKMNKHKYKKLRKRLRRKT